MAYRKLLMYMGETDYGEEHTADVVTFPSANGAKRKAGVLLPMQELSGTMRDRTVAWPSGSERQP